MTAILEKTSGLLAFVRTAETGSFSQAGRLLVVSPSAVSKSVARLEQRLGMKLIQRSTRALNLTEEGAVYFDRVAPLLQGIEDAEQALHATDDVTGLLRVTAPGDLGRTLFAGLVRDFSARYPGLKLELGIDDRYVDLIREGYDLAIRIGDLQDNRLTARKLANLRTVLVASPAYLSVHGVPAHINDLRQHACLRYVTPRGPYPWTWADGTRLVPDGPFDTNDGSVLKYAALSDAGIAQLSEVAVAAEIESGALLVVLPHLPMPSLEMHAVHAYGRQVPIRLQVFMEFLQQQFSPVPGRTNKKLKK
ncbi:MAG TPA: LysR family transcriptional regulator [Alcaligenes sp.]|nr:LysR family transcriptional regulator [Alcaligenes sp.]HRL27058.1 LysR family transcriptional regulator [Alcaligenes sp.]